MAEHEMELVLGDDGGVAHALVAPLGRGGPAGAPDFQGTEFQSETFW